MLESILPPWAVGVEAFADPPLARIFPEEEALVAGAADKRVREFRTGRLCAHRAMGLIGLEPRPVLRGERGAPMWPAGVVGSITHCAGYRAAAIARGALAIGIDAEPHRPAPPGVLDRIATAEEIAGLDRLGVEEPDLLLFSAKESVYKAWNPLTGHWLGFLDVVVTFDPAGGFTARVTPPAPAPDGAPAALSGRWLVSRGLLLTSVVVAAAPRR